MFESLFSYPFLFLIVPAWFIIKGLFFSFQKKYILSNYKQSDSQKLKSIYGTIITESGAFRKNIQWCTFDILINQNSIFIFPKSYYFIPRQAINLVFSNSDKKYTKRPSLLREYKIGKHSIELIHYPAYLLTGSSKIFFKNLTSAQLTLLNNALEGKTRKVLV